MVVLAFPKISRSVIRKKRRREGGKEEGKEREGGGRGKEGKGKEHTQRVLKYYQQHLHYITESHYQRHVR